MSDIALGLVKQRLQNEPALVKKTLEENGENLLGWYSLSAAEREKAVDLAGYLDRGELPPPETLPVRESGSNQRPMQTHLRGPSAERLWFREWTGKLALALIGFGLMLSIGLFPTNEINILVDMPEEYRCLRIVTTWLPVALNSLPMAGGCLAKDPSELPSGEIAFLVLSESNNLTLDFIDFSSINVTFVQSEVESGQKCEK